MKHALTIIVSCFSATFAASAADVAAAWSGWRGGSLMGVSPAANVPVAWSTNQNVRWIIPAPGRGIAYPVVWGGRVFATGCDGSKPDNPNQLHVVCYHRADGAEIWRTRFWAGHMTEFHNYPSMAAPSPVTDGERLYVLFGTGDVFCFDWNGTMLWTRSLPQDYGAYKTQQGMTSSPVLTDDALVCLQEHTDAGFIVAMDKLKGRTLWKLDRGKGQTFGSPIFVKHDGRAEVIVASRGAVFGLDPATGREIWRCASLSGVGSPSPVARDGVLYVRGGGGTHAIKLGGTGELKKAHLLWSSPKGAKGLSSPAVDGQHVYLLGDEGILNCLDAKSGKVLYQERLGGPNERFFCSPAIADGKLYVQHEDGDTEVIRLGPRFERLARNSIGEQTNVGPALADGMILLRGRKNLFCIGATKQEEPGGLLFPAR